jgi:predicted transcriptional regulator
MSHRANSLSPEEEAALEAELRSFSDEELAALKQQLITEIVDGLRVNITARQIEVFVAVLYHHAATVSQIARAIGQDAGNTHRRLNSLVRKGLVRREARGGYFVYTENLS